MDWVGSTNENGQGRGKEEPEFGPGIPFVFRLESVESEREGASRGVEVMWLEPASEAVSKHRLAAEETLEFRGPEVGSDDETQCKCFSARSTFASPDKKHSMPYY